MRFAMYDTDTYSTFGMWFASLEDAQKCANELQPLFCQHYKVLQLIENKWVTVYEV